MQKIYGNKKKRKGTKGNRRHVGRGEFHKILAPSA